MTHHAKKLTGRFELHAYKTMNHLLGSIDITRNGQSFEELIKIIESEIHIFSIDSDLFFPLEEDQETVSRASAVGVKINHQIISSDFGHDAFLMEPWFNHTQSRSQNKQSLFSSGLSPWDYQSI